MVTALAVTAATLTVPASPAAAREPVAEAPQATAQDADQAATQARRTGVAVEVESLRTERERRLVNPDGTWTLEQSVEPVRVRRSDGTWTAVDTTLRRAGDLVRPAAVTADVAFSAGGTGPMAVLGTGRGRLALTWPGNLPTPTLAGDTATYAEVLPGVDLVLRSTVDGFAHVVVVKNRAAATDPRLATLRFGMSGGDLRLRPTAVGDLEAVTGSGTVAATAGGALMWDAGPGDLRSTVAVAGERARRAAPRTRVEGADLVIEPDLAMLTDPSARFPIFIDPSYAKGYRAWGYTNSANENNDQTVARVGRSPDSGAVYRSAFRFDVNQLRHTRILDAKLQTTLTHSWSCAATPVNLYRSASFGAGKLAWAGPALQVWIDERSGNAHKGANDCGNQPDLPMEFSRNLKADVQAAANANWGSYHLVLSARKNDGSGESTESWWKKFSPSATKLVVVYNSAPGVPGSLSADGAGCGTGNGRPLVSTANPTLRALVTDPDADETDLRASFEWQRYDGAAWVALGSGQQTALRTGATAQFRVNTTLAHNGIYRWRVNAIDPYSHAGVSGVDESGWSAYCEFGVDLVGPGSPPGVSSAVYLPNLDQSYGAVGLSADFTFTAAGVSDVAGYKWGWADPPTTLVSVAAGASATLPLTPPPIRADPTSGGPMTLYVVSVDGAGRASPLRTYTFRVGPATGPVGVWLLNEAAGATTLADTNQRGTQRPATLTNGTAGVAGLEVGSPARAAATAVRFNGSTSTAATAGPVVDTSRSFSVSAWVRLNNASAPFQTAVGQAGTAGNAFFLQYNNGRWAFAAPDADVASRPLSSANTPAGTPTRWTHLIGVYDAQGSQMRLYINGALAATATRTNPWNGSRFLTIGHVRYGATTADAFNGEIAQVRVWDRVVSAREAAPMAATLVGRWRLDGDGSDATAYARTAAPTAGVAWAEDRDFLPLSAAGLAAADSLTTAGPVVRTDQSFTMTAWVSLDSTAAGAQIAVSQSGTRVHAARLGYYGTGTTYRWLFRTVPGDADTPGSTLYSTTPAEAGEWVHLAGVWEASTGTLRFYVNGLLEASAVTGEPFASTGPMTIGRNLVSGVYGESWRGAVDDVRLYAGALPATEIATLCAC
ncbi:hypothetical protein Vau01_016330 [Virgisporangium aurantiacum]|uniref:LamG-like jellyroll fold domain-containing protein n=2 Tax=Virgisporangium aurantiacum TaxID=175570 RepID=A0A8J4DZK0_9ACTN|nr:hypothetical protein Vau01_016330 [Virgisporangium aurantiacum]